MTQILFKDNKFWIDGIEILNPDIMPFYFKDIRDGIWYYTQEHNHSFKDDETFPLPENLSYEVACNYDCCNENGACEHCQKPVIRLKLKEMKNETPEQARIKEINDLQNKVWETTENGAEKPYTMININEEYEKQKEVIQQLQKENDFLHKAEVSWFEQSAKDLDKISDLEAQLVKAINILKMIEVDKDFDSLGPEITKYILDFLFTNEVKE